MSSPGTPASDGPAQAQSHGVRSFLAGRYLEALAAFERVIALDPRFPPAHHNRGLALDHLGRTAEALAAYDLAIDLAPDYAMAHDNRGVALRKLGRFPLALESHQRALALDPGFAEAHANLAAALYELGRLAEALVAAERAIALKPGLFSAHVNRAAILYRLDRPAESIDAYERALALAPGDAAARFGLGMARLLTGDMAAGWRDYEARKAVLGDPAAGLAASKAWHGEAVAGQRLLILSEQGLGDTLQFARFAPRLQALGAHVMLSSPASLVGLLGRSLPGVELVGEGGAAPGHDRHAALLSLPWFLSLGADLAPSAGWLRTDPAKVERWRARLGQRRRRRIGLVWRGAAHHPDDRNRSIALERLACLASLDVDWICLQDRLRPEDGPVAERLGILRPGHALSDFDETAALTSLMDEVVSVDTSVAHLAASLGRPTRILLPFSPDWRWGRQAPTTPWYDTARLYRQPTIGDWGSVIAALRSDLEA